MCVCFTWETSLWFSLNQVSLMAALRSKRLASCSSFSWRMSSVLRASSRSCSAFSRRSQAYHNAAFGHLLLHSIQVQPLWGQGSWVRGQGSGLTLLMSEMSLPSRGVYTFWLLALIRLWMVNRRTSKFPFSVNLRPPPPQSPSSSHPHHHHHHHHRDHHHHHYRQHREHHHH